MQANWPLRNQLARPFKPRDFAQIEQWFKARGHGMAHPSLFPSNGFIVDNVAAGFVYLTDSRIAIIDSYISNPESSDKARDEALNEITDRLIKTAVEDECVLIKCDTQIEAIKTRAKKFGFETKGLFESFSLEL